MDPKNNTAPTNAPAVVKPTRPASPREAAAYLGLSEWTIRRLLRDGEIPARKIGSQWRIDPEYFRTLDGAF